MLTCVRLEFVVTRFRGCFPDVFGTSRTSLWDWCGDDVLFLGTFFSLKRHCSIQDGFSGVFMLVSTVSFMLWVRFPTHWCGSHGWQKSVSVSLRAKFYTVQKRRWIKLQTFCNSSHFTCSLFTQREDSEMKPQTLQLVRSLFMQTQRNCETLYGSNS